uniref:Uncharacterized protein n=1 Tax=Timema bartmani TaxID=61472 RepID=A0A7R9HXZ2_9NEOP|nr:unnamed protein product [Timema bartmani]
MAVGTPFQGDPINSSVRMINDGRDESFTKSEDNGHLEQSTYYCSTKITLSPQSSTVKEERRNTGRYVVVIVVACACLLGLYQACLQQNAVLAGLIVPALIMVIYVAWVLYTARHSQKQIRSIRPTHIIRICGREEKQRKTLAIGQNIENVGPKTYQELKRKVERRSGSRTTSDSSDS